MEIRVVTEPQTEKVGREVVKNLLEPEVEKFSLVFQKLSGTPLTSMEKEILKAYLFHKLKSNAPQNI